MFEILFFLFGLILGALTLFLLHGKKDDPILNLKKEQAEKERDNLFSESQAYKQKEKEWIEQSSELKKEAEHLKKALGQQKDLYEEKLHEKEESYKKELDILKSHHEQIEEKSRQLTEKTKTDFKNIFNEITKSYKEESTKNLSEILQPFKENIDGFKKSIQSLENKEKVWDDTLKDFKDINLKMRDDTIKLTQALKGDTNVQGQWGEFVLTNILEKSALRKGEDFIVQESIKNGEGRPDVIVKLPEKKHIIIDSKVSLTHYNEYISSNKEEERNEILKKILSSIKSHIDNLASKKYQDSEELKSPDFILMFIPNEGIFSVVTQAEDLFEKAWKQRVVIVGPTTLFATLKTIASIWRIERQNKNAQKIAAESGRLYDKFKGFVDDMLDLEKGLKVAQNSYDRALNKLQTGKGNLIDKAEKIKKLGANTTKSLPEKFTPEKEPTPQIEDQTANHPI